MQGMTSGTVGLLVAASNRFFQIQIRVLWVKQQYTIGLGISYTIYSR